MVGSDVKNGDRNYERFMKMDEDDEIDRAIRRIRLGGNEGFAFTMKRRVTDTEYDDVDCHLRGVPYSGSSEAFHTSFGGVSSSYLVSRTYAATSPSVVVQSQTSVG